MSVEESRSPCLPGYETIFITKVDLAQEELKELQNKLARIVSQYGGEVVICEDWKKQQKLAYKIQKESRGNFTYIVFTGKGQIIHEIERNLRLHDSVIRFLTVNLASEFDPAQFKKQRENAQLAAKRREEEREARRDERGFERRYFEDRSGDLKSHDFEDSGDEKFSFKAEARSKDDSF